MTAQLPILSRDREAVLAFAADFAPPHAPMHMPKQVLRPAPGRLRRGLMLLISALPTGRHRPG